jgi:hypothetical protein
MANSTPALAAVYVECKARLQGLQRDFAALEDHLRSPFAKPGVGARVMACVLSSTVVTEWLARMQICAMAEEDKLDGR